MAWAAKRDESAKRWTAYYYDEHNIQRQKSGYSSRTSTEELARKLEDECRKIRDGLVDPAERSRREATGRPLVEHIADYRAILAARGNTKGHVGATASAIGRLLKAGNASLLSELDGNHVLTGLAIWRGKGRAARTLNHALVAVQGFARWLAASKRIAEADPLLMDLNKYDERGDMRIVRRALSPAEVAKLLAAAESGRTLTREAPLVPRVKGKRGGWGQKGRARKVAITGPDRAALYRVAMATGFRANELRSLTVDSFALDGDEPTITLKAAHSKNGKGAIQPITREMAEAIKPYLAKKCFDSAALVVPEKTAKLIRVDLDAAGVPYEVKGEGVVDFHALRHSYITHLIRSGANPKIVQALARHADIRLTLERYTHLESDDLRKAIEGEL